MADNNKEHTEHIIGLTELMVETMHATIDADRNTADEYYRILEDYAFKPSEDENAPDELQMVDFKIVNSNGQAQIISMPKLILMPVPMLHVAEANFELEGSVCLTETVETETEQKPSERNTLSRQNAGGRSSQQASIRRLNYSEVLAKRSATARLRMSLPSVKKTSEENETSESKTNMKINIKLTQSDMPSGLASLLQVITNNIQVKNE